MCNGVAVVSEEEYSKIMGAIERSREASPLRRALRSHFTQYKGLTTVQESLGASEPEYPIYKDTASGSQA